jgi:hypothetical protein
LVISLTDLAATAALVREMLFSFSKFVVGVAAKEEQELYRRLKRQLNEKLARI